MSTVQPGTVMVDRYRLTQPASTDLATAEAWEAHDQILDRPVRVTFVDGPQSAAALDAARRAALVADSRLCRVLDVGTTDLGAGERSYVITEPFAGESLTQIVSRGLVDAQQARALMGEAATALEAARRRGVHHCALRPEAVRVDGHRVVVTGLGIDAGLAGIEPADTEAAAMDARGLVALGYYALTARWAADSLEVPWIAPDAVRPLPAQTGPDGVVPVSELVPHVDDEIDVLVRRTFTGDDAGAPATPADIVAALEPWGQVSVVAALPRFVQPPERPVRSSVLGAGSPAGSASRPGTPPPRPPCAVRPPGGSPGQVSSAPGRASRPVPPTGSLPRRAPFLRLPARGPTARRRPMARLPPTGKDLPTARRLLPGSPPLRPRANLHRPAMPRQRPGSPQRPRAPLRRRPAPRPAASPRPPPRRSVVSTRRRSCSASCSSASCSPPSGR